MKSLFVICNKDGNPFFTDPKGVDRYNRTWAFKNEEIAKESIQTKDEQIVEYRPVKGK